MNQYGRPNVTLVGNVVSLIAFDELESRGWSISLNQVPLALLL